MPERLNPQQLTAAAFRLKHDLGKAVRLNAPVHRERDVERLRQRLETDLLRTRSGAEGSESAVEVFDRWLAEEAEPFRSVPRWNESLERMSRAIETIRGLLPHLATLSLGDLAILDDATALLNEESAALYRDVFSTRARDTWE